MSRFVHHGKHQALHDLVVAHAARCQLIGPAVADNHGVNRWAGNRFAGAGLIVIPTCSGFLTIATLLAEQVGDLAVAQVRVLHRAALAYGPTNVVTR